VIGYLITASGLGGLAFLNQWLTWYASHAYWFVGSALLFLGIAVYFLLFKYPTRKNKYLLGLNVLSVGFLLYYYWL